MNRKVSLGNTAYKIKSHMPKYMKRVAEISDGISANIINIKESQLYI